MSPFFYQVPQADRRNDMSGQINRRVFVQRAAFGAGAWWILHNSRSAWSYAANEKLNLAVVGVGRRGAWHASTVPRVGQNLVALCDVDSRLSELWRDKAPGVPWYQDFRHMLDEQDTRLDGVIAALPAHNHAAVGAAAMRRGKHVYLEKPLAQNVGEARVLRQIAAEEQVATQMGNQGMATDSFRRTLELVQDGALGEIREAHVWFVYGGPGPRDLPTGEQLVPDSLNWDVWLGPLAFRPYHPAWMSGAWREVGTGVLGGCGAHAINLAFKGLRLGALWGTDDKVAGTIRIEAEPSEISPNTFPRWQIIHYDIPARGDLPPVHIHWYNASQAELQRQGIWQRLEAIAGRSIVSEGSWTPESGSLLVGSRGVVHTNAHNSICSVLPESDFPDAAGPPQRLPRVPGHEREWMAACRGDGTPLSNFNHSGPAIELLLLGNVATLFDKPLEFDPMACRIVNNDEADRLLRPARREGWEFTSVDGADTANG
jgi:hypothetical protein